MAQLSASQLGALAAQHAPDVPIELLGAVFKTESGYGSDNAAYVPNASGAIGPGQILSSALGAKYGNFEAYYPGGDPRNSEHATIAALRKIRNDWQKANGDITGFAKRYFGAGQDAEGRNAVNHYVPKLTAAISAQATDPNFAQFAQGYGVTTQPTSTPFNDNRFEAMLAGQPVGIPAGGVPNPNQPTQPNPLDPNSVVVAQQTSSIEDIISRINQSTQAVGQAQTGVDTVAVQQKTELAKQSQEILTMLGLNPAVTNSEIESTAVALQAAHSQTVQTSEQLRQARQDPIFNVLDQFTQGTLSRVQDARIAQGTAQVEVLTKSLANLQAVAQRQIQLGSTATYSLAEEEIKAKAALNEAKANADATKLGIREELAADRRATQDQVRDFNEAFKQRVQEFREQNATARLVNNTTGRRLTVTEQFRLGEQQAFEALASNNAEALGMSVEQLSLLTGGGKNPNNKNYWLLETSLDPNGPLPLRFAKFKAQQNKYSPADTKLFNESIGRNGWASPVNPANETIVSQGFKSLTQQAMEGKRVTEEDRQAAIDNEIGLIAARKRELIVNDGSITTLKNQPYGANFGRLEQIAASPALTVTDKIFSKVVESPIYQEIKSKNAANSLDKRAVSDMEVVDTIARMAKEKGLSPAEAAQQGAEYYQAQVKANNLTYKFDKFGLPLQETYPVPVLTSNPSQNWIAEKYASQQQGSQRPRPQFRMVDLTNPTEFQSLLITRMVPDWDLPEFLTRGFLAPIGGIITRTYESANQVRTMEPQR